MKLPKHSDITYYRERGQNRQPWPLRALAPQSHSSRGVRPSNCLSFCSLTRIEFESLEYQLRNDLSGPVDRSFGRNRRLLAWLGSSTALYAWVARTGCKTISSFDNAPLDTIHSLQSLPHCQSPTWPQFDLPRPSYCQAPCSAASTQPKLWNHV